jgi:plastocyanin
VPSMTMRTVAAAATITAAVAVGALVAGCSNRQAAPNRRGHTGSATASVENGVQQVTLTVDDKFRFSPSTITVHPGNVTITLVHKGSGAPHDFSVDGHPGDDVPLVRAGGTESQTFTTPAPGTYRFVCTLHIAQGMTGTLVVLPS